MGSGASRYYLHKSSSLMNEPLTMSTFFTNIDYAKVGRAGTVLARSIWTLYLGSRLLPGCSIPDPNIVR